MIDTHTHLDFKSFDNDRDEILARFFSTKSTLRSSAQQSKVGGIGRAIINIGTDKEGNEWGVDFVKKHKKVFTTVSYHPEEAGKISCKDAINCLSMLAKNNKEVVAIGEIGLDYFHNDKNKKEQKELFEAQLNLASNLKKPIVIHCRDAYEDVYGILKSKVKSACTRLTGEKLKVVIHCYGGNAKQTEKFLDLGCWFSFTGNITFAKKENPLIAHSQPTPPLKKGEDDEPEIFKVIKMIPLERIMVETDTPFLTPVPHRGERNEPVYVRHVIEKIAEVKKSSFKEVEEQTDKNAIEFFSLRISY